MKTEKDRVGQEKIEQVEVEKQGKAGKV